ncbi:MAG: tRNA epoxyqueuosine(34) reductase QueG [Actinomycetota bacterium]|nr:tRNA epoxyqueuosine(34) reductase QueG [Actinomycetota bacterium]
MLEDLAAELRVVGRGAGLDAIGFAGAQPFEDTREVLERRRQEGLAATMQFTYRNPARSTDPSRSLPSAASLVVGARRYLRQPAPHSTGSALRDAEMAGSGEGRALPGGAEDQGGVAARVARYSWVDHYAPLRAALGAIADRLNADGWSTRILVDDNALVDRAAAHRAGLGWFGRNTNLLLPGAGSWFVLGSVVTDAPLPPGQPVADGCGPCRRCIPACPTGALSGDGALDARRCLAWLVQAPGVFPLEHRQALGDRIYGCDACQEVCPANRRAARTDPPAGAEPDATPVVDALAMLESSDEELLSRWGRWYIAERDPRYLRRNALIVIGNAADAGHPRVVKLLRDALSSGDPLVRSHAVWAAARLGRSEMVAAMTTDADPLVAAEVAATTAVTPRSDGATGSVRFWRSKPRLQCSPAPLA